jgi:hypothetical protein
MRRDRRGARRTASLKEATMAKQYTSCVKSERIELVDKYKSDKADKREKIRGRLTYKCK